MKPPVVPNGAGAVYLSGSFQVSSWILFTHGLFNESGVCANSFSPAGACGVYVGVWTPQAWQVYEEGGPMSPIWCYPGNGTPCTNVTSGSLGTPNLSAYDGTSWEIVIWNIDTYSLSGTYSFTVYSDVPRPL